MRRTVFLLALSAMLVLCTVGCQNPAQSDGTTYTITFDSQNATTAADPATKTVTSPVTTVDALPTAPVKTGYNFGGWWTAVDGGGTEFTASTEVTANSTVYAKWLKTIISFNANGGAGTTTAVVLNTDTLTLRTLANSFTYTDKVFYGWSKTADGPIVAATETLSPGSGDLTLYARWQTASSTFQNLAWSDLRSSDDMKHLAAVVGGTTVASGLYVSNDYGLSWTQKISRATTLGATQGGTVFDCDVSANGQHMLAVSRYDSATTESGAIWYSSNYGTSWTNIGTSAQTIDFATIPLEGCALSDDGTKRVVAVPNGHVYNWTGTAWVAVTSSPASFVDIDYAGDGSVFVVGQYNNDSIAFTTSGSYSLDTWSGSYSGSGAWQGRELLVSKNGDMVLFAPKPGAFNATLWSLSGSAQSAPLATISDSYTNPEANGSDATWNADGSFKTGYLAAASRGIIKFAVPAIPSGTIAPTAVNGTGTPGATNLLDKLTWEWNGIAVSPDEQTLVAVARYMDATKVGGMYLSTDGGATWTRVF